MPDESQPSRLLTPSNNDSRAPSRSRHRLAPCRHGMFGSQCIWHRVVKPEESLVYTVFHIAGIQTIFKFCRRLSPDIGAARLFSSFAFAALVGYPLDSV
jgi:hypothetical protein